MDGEFSSDHLCRSISTSDEPICVGVYLKLEPYSPSEYLLCNEFQDDTYTTQFVNDVNWEVKRLGYVFLDSYIIFLPTKHQIHTKKESSMKFTYMLN